MKRGETEVDTLHLNGWGIGDILEGTEGCGSYESTDRLVITAIGETSFLCKWNYGKGFKEEKGNATLEHREWKKVDEDKAMKRRAGFWGAACFNLTNEVRELKKKLSGEV